MQGRRHCACRAFTLTKVNAVRAELSLPSLTNERCARTAFIHFESLSKVDVAHAQPNTFTRSSLSSYIENILVVTGKDMKRTLRENPRSPWKSRNQRNSGDQAFDCMWRTCKWANRQMRAPSSDHPQYLHSRDFLIIDQAR